ncbi:MAG: inositol monophosphatase [Phycisphaerae bacterium]
MYKNDVTIAKRAAVKAGAEALNQQSRIRSTLKNGSEIVTQADPICQQIIIDELLASYPDDGIVAEEGEAGAVYVRRPKGDSQRYWIIDPIDGTNNYSLRLDIFAISIALIEAGEPVVGVVYWPSADRMFEASQNGGMFVNGVRRFVADAPLTKNALIAYDSHWPGGIPAPMMAYYSRCKVRNLGTSALHLAYVASGALHFCVINKNKIWDFAAGAVLVREAGGKITTQDGSSLFPIDPAETAGKNFKLIASNGILHDELARAIRCSTP